MSGTGGSTSGQNEALRPKAIASLAKKQADGVTRQGTTKLKFTPTLPPRRKKEEAKSDTATQAPSASTSNNDAGPGRGRGRGGGRGRGRGDGRPNAPRPPQEMVASGPFALGPARAGSSARRIAPRSNFAAPSFLSTRPASGEKKPSGIKRDDDDEDKELYSDPDDANVEIVDIGDVRELDWMAPESLRKEKAREKGKGKKKVSLKRENETAKVKGKVKAEPQDPTLGMDVEEEEKVNNANALDLSESEEEEESINLLNDFALQDEDDDMDPTARQERIYFFQFPEPFPTFDLPPSSSPPIPQGPTQDSPATTNTNKEKAPEGKEKEKGKKAVSFAPDVKLPPPSESGTPVPPGSTTITSATTQQQQQQKIDGVIGRLEIHQSGAVRMRLANNILLDVTAAMHPSFLQHAIHLDTKTKHVHVLGEITRRFVVSPNMDSLLESLERADFQEKAQDAMIVD